MKVLLDTCVLSEIRHPQSEPLPAIDGLIAATAIRHNLAVMTRNTEDFEPTGAKIINPWTPPGIHET